MINKIGLTLTRTVVIIYKHTYLLYFFILDSCELLPTDDLFGQMLIILQGIWE